MLLTVTEAAALLAVGRSTAYKLVLAGQLKSVKLGRRRLVVRTSLQEFIEQLLEEQDE
jgi:excisionase family DNA binding protein